MNPQPRTLRAAEGYTLLELLVVIAIMALIAALSTPAVETMIDAATFRSDARRLASQLEHFREEARERAATITISASDKGPGLAVSSGDKLAVSPSAQLRLAGDTTDITYYPDGTCSGGTIELAESGLETALAIAWLTGTVQIGESSDAQ